MTIAKQDFDRFMNQARVKLVGASDAGIKLELYEVLSEFLNDSSAWQEVIPIDVIEDHRSYTLPTGEGQIIRYVGSFDKNGVPVPASMPEIGSVLLGAKYEPQTIHVIVAKNVSLPTTKGDIPLAPDWLFPVWHVVLLDGILGKMMTQANKSFSNQTLGVYHLRRFRDGISRAKTSMLRANSFGTQAWRFPRGWQTHSQSSGVPTWGNGRTF